MNLPTINKFVLHKQRLTGKKAEESLAETIKAIGGLHATNATTPYLSLFVRIEKFRREQLDTVLYAKRTLGKIRYVRTTVHVLPKDMIPAAFAATRNMIEPVSEAYSRTLGVTKEQYTTASSQIMQLLEIEKGLTAKQIKQKIGTKLNVSSIVNLMCNQGLPIRGAPENGWKSNMHTYYLFKDYFPDLDLTAENEKDARTAVVRQYLASFAPVTENDVAWWTGFTKSQVEQIIRELKTEITRVDVSGLDKELIMLSQDKTALVAAEAAAKHVVSMVPTLDPYLMGYKNRERYLDPAYYNYVFDRSGNATATILLDGEVVGVWDFEAPFIKIFLFNKVAASVQKEIHAKARRIGVFISGKEAKTKECESMIPLVQRTAGGVMSPLRNC